MSGRGLFVGNVCLFVCSAGAKRRPQAEGLDFLKNSIGKERVTRSTYINIFKSLVEQSKCSIVLATIYKGGRFIRVYKKLRHETKSSGVTVVLYTL